MIDEGTEHAEMNTSAYIREEEVKEEDSHLLSWYVLMGSELCIVFVFVLV